MTLAEIAGTATLDQLDELEDEYQDDRILQEIRAKRMRERREEIARQRYGEVREIGPDDWVREGLWGWVIGLRKQGGPCNQKTVPWAAQ